LAHSRFGPLIAPTPRKKEVSGCFFTSYSIFINLLEVLYQCVEVFFGLLKHFLTMKSFLGDYFLSNSRCIQNLDMHLLDEILKLVSKG